MSKFGCLSVLMDRFFFVDFTVHPVLIPKTCQEVCLSWVKFQSIELFA